MDVNERFQKQFLKDMRDVLEESGLSERWELDEGKSFLYGNGGERFQWEYDVILKNKENPNEGLEIYGFDEGKCSIGRNGEYDPYSLDFKESGFGLYNSDGQELTDFEEGSDEEAFRDAFEAWLDFWYEDWYGERA